jgi:hypothetical protein
LTWSKIRTLGRRKQNSRMKWGMWNTSGGIWKCTPNQKAEFYAVRVLSQFNILEKLHNLWKQNNQKQSNWLFKNKKQNKIKSNNAKRKTKTKQLKTYNKTNKFYDWPRNCHMYLIRSDWSWELVWPSLMFTCFSMNSKNSGVCS